MGYGWRRLDPFVHHLRQPRLSRINPPLYIWNAHDRDKTGITSPSYCHLLGYYRGHDQYDEPLALADWNRQTPVSIYHKPRGKFSVPSPDNRFPIGIILWYICHMSLQFCEKYAAYFSAKVGVGLSTIEDKYSNANTPLARFSSYRDVSTAFTGILPKVI